jgi:hypothetical protein
MEKQLKEERIVGESSSAFKRKHIYSREGLLPEDILYLIPYK